MKINIVAARTREKLEEAIAALIAGDVHVHSVAYAIGPKGEREALGGEREDAPSQERQTQRPPRRNPPGGDIKQEER